MRLPTLLLLVLLAFEPALGKKAKTKHHSKHAKSPSHKAPKNLSKSRPSSGSNYKLAQSYSGQSLLSMFNFAQGQSDNNGVANYLSYASAKQAGIVSVGKNGQVALKIGSQPNQHLRESVRLVSKQTFNGGLFVFDIAAIPSACGVWPSLWMTGSNWPQDGEIDIIEGVHETTMNAMSTHTNQGCTQGTSGYSGTFMMAGSNKNNCNAYATSSQGCGVRSPHKSSFGAPFNNQGGGTYALNWGSDGIATYFFPKGQVPSDITSGKPNPSAWSAHRENYVAPGGCNPQQHFQNLMLVINTNLCGTWPTGTWNQDMSYAGAVSGSCAQRTGYGTCESYVAAHGAGFANAKWLINSIKIYQH